LRRLTNLVGLDLNDQQLSATLEDQLTGEFESTDIYAVFKDMSWGMPLFFEAPDDALVPMLFAHPMRGWGVITNREPNMTWRVEFQDEVSNLPDSIVNTGLIATIDGSSSQGKERQPTTFRAHLRKLLKEYNSVLFEASLASLFITLLAVGTSLFSMQVYDRVIPTKGEATLALLTIGVGIAIAFEFILKIARSRIMDRVVIGLDEKLSRAVFERLLAIRVDQLPTSVGSLAGQLRAYEQIRSFYTSSTLFALVDLPLAFVFVAIIFLIGNVCLAAIPLIAVLLAVGGGVFAASRINKLVGKNTITSNQKTGLVVEAVEGIETIKSGAGKWKFISRWIHVVSESITTDLQIRSLSEKSTYFAGMLQQASYVGLVVYGAWSVINGETTTGAMVACSLLSGRVLAPTMALPGLIIQHAHSEAAIEGLERLYALRMDTEMYGNPLIPTKLSGSFSLRDVEYSFSENIPAISVSELKIQSGERVAIIGTIGSGKSTLLRLLSGILAAQRGSVLVDNMDVTQISRQVISRQIGYLQQEHRLFQGSIRDNLLIGLVDPGDDRINEALTQTGMHAIVSQHPKGLERNIYEGGKGLSGGQRQLLAFTRLLLIDSPVLLLDEPTASMDEYQEQQCIDVLKREATAGKTLIISTHKPSLLQLVDRVIVLANQRLVMDGPREAVLQKLRERNAS
jgi:ATP-binding cassette subfamily C protein LapB